MFCLELTPSEKGENNKKMASCLPLRVYPFTLNIVRIQYYFQVHIVLGRPIRLMLHPVKQ